MPRHLSSLEKAVEFKKLFNHDAHYPGNHEEIMGWFSEIMMALEAENLTCDGELSQYEVIKNFKNLVSQWEELECLIGGTMDEEMVCQWKFSKLTEVTI